MKPRTLIICASLTACGLSIAGVVLQARQLDALRGEGQQLQERLKNLREEQVRRANSSEVVKPVISSPSSELLRLRNQVSQLARRERELAGVAVENQRLRGQVAAAVTNAAKALPSGYIRKSAARYLGYTTPEATLETMLWAIRSDDITNVLAAFSPEIAEQMQQKLMRDEKFAEQFFKGAQALPGFHVLDRVATDSNTMELKVSITPNNSDEARPMRFRLISGEWKVDEH